MISDLLRERQEILVQIAKEPLGQKGARITSHIALPGRYVVYMPTVDHLGRLPQDRFRRRATAPAGASSRTTAQACPGGYIVRTAGEGKSERDIAADMMFLYNLWLDIRQKAEKRPAPALIHHDLDIVQRLLRDQLADSFKAIWMDNEEVYEGVLRFVERLQPALVSRVKMYTRQAPILDAFNITTELEKALRPKVWLKSGGYIVVNQTEALVAIDVNTGKFVGKSNRLEDTIVKTNIEAIKEIVRQMRLRDLGGIIVVDFIDMDERKNRQKVMQALEDEMQKDRAPYKILQFNDFGLVAITRKRVKQSLERTLCSPCPACDGAGYVKSVQTVDRRDPDRGEQDRRRGGRAEASVPRSPSPRRSSRCRACPAPGRRSAREAMPVRMPLRAAYTAAAAPAGPPPTISTSNGASPQSSAASRFAAPVSTLARISSRLMRPWPKCVPLRKTVGTAMTSRSCTSSWNSAPSIMVARMRGFWIAIRFSACTTSGQLWQVSET